MKINGKNRVISLFTISMLVGMLMFSCDDVSELGVFPVDNTPPTKPELVEVENLNGAAIIRYTVPQDNDLLYVCARYQINGKEYEAMSSAYNDFVKVEGFGLSDSYKVSLISVDKSKNQSEPLLVDIHPLEPPVELVYKTLSVQSGFGGLKLTWENPTESNIIVTVQRKDSVGEWQNLESFYSSASKGQGTVRGLDTIPMTIGVKIRDRWDNYSETNISEQKPLFEEEADKLKFREMRLPGDAEYINSDLTARKMWDGNTTSASSCMHTDYEGIGKCITFDLGQLVKLSRYKMWQRAAYLEWIYDHNNLKHYEIYGCDNITEEMFQSGSLDGWTLLKDVHVYKPSGDSGVVTDEDIEYARAGAEEEVDINLPPVRYIRLKFLETWSGTFAAQIEEMSFWGQIIE